VFFLFNLVQTIIKLAGGYYKYLGKEDKLQHQVMAYIASQYPFALATHIANEGKRSPFERFKFKYLGAKAGIPDVKSRKKQANRITEAMAQGS
jgi:hypothetical protein